MSDESKIKRAIDLIFQFGGICGEHHKQWVLDQVVRILTGCSYREEKGIDDYGIEYDYYILFESEEYLRLIGEYSRGGYSWDKGIAP